jgi:hypothetical protein
MNVILGRLFRFLKRLTVLVPGVIVAYFTVEKLYPPLNKRLPAAVAILLIYILLAYVLIPFAIRVLHLVVPPKHIPLYSTTPDGLASDPINVGVIATQQELIDLMKAAGWHRADPRNVHTLARMVISVILKQPYPNAPFSKLFLFGRSQDLGFQLPVDDTPTHRHHIRFWGVTDTESEEYRQHAFFWLRHHRSPKKGRILWVGAASLDTGIGIIRHNAQFTHMIHHDTNAEREFVVTQLKKTKQVKRTRTIEVGAPYRLTNRVITGYMSADGKVKVLELR